MDFYDIDDIEEMPFIATGYLTDDYGNRISKDFVRPTKAVSFEQALSRIMWSYKTKVLKLTSDYKVRFVGDIRTNF